MRAGNSLIRQRLSDLVAEGELQWEEFAGAGDGVIKDPIRFTEWTTSCLNLLDKLSVSSNRFVKEFESWVSPGPRRLPNLGAALGVLKSARTEYSLGLAIEYHLSVSAAVFDGLLDEANYLLSKGYLRAAAVLMGAALEEGLKTRARAAGIEVGPKETLTPLIGKLKASGAHLLNEFAAKRLEALARMRNDAAHGGDFSYQLEDVSRALQEVRETLEQLLKHS